MGQAPITRDRIACNNSVVVRRDFSRDSVENLIAMSRLGTVFSHDLLHFVIVFAEFSRATSISCAKNADYHPGPGNLETRYPFIYLKNESSILSLRTMHHTTIQYNRNNTQFIGSLHFVVAVAAELGLLVVPAVVAATPAARNSSSVSSV